MGKIPRRIRLRRERERLDAIAQERGFENLAALLYDLYSVQDIPIETIARDLVTPIWTLRKKFDELGITVSPRGGRQSSFHIEMTQELFNEICRDGIQVVAERLGVTASILDIHAKRWYEAHKDEMKKETTS